MAAVNVVGAAGDRELVAAATFTAAATLTAVATGETFGVAAMAAAAALAAAGTVFPLSSGIAALAATGTLRGDGLRVTFTAAALAAFATLTASGGTGRAGGPPVAAVWNQRDDSTLRPHSPGAPGRITPVAARSGTLQAPASGHGALHPRPSGGRLRPS
jgi:hypothetical protein